MLTASPLTVLLVDDDEDVRTVARIGLEMGGGFRVVAVASGEEALARVGEVAPQVLLMDVRMEGLGGPATLEILRSRPETRAIPVVFLTAEAEDPARYLAMGALGILRKPFDPRELAPLLRRLLST